MGARGRRGQYPISGKAREVSSPGASALQPPGVDPVLDELLPERVPVDAEDLRGAHLVAARLAEHGAQERLLHETQHQLVEVCARVLAEPTDALDELLLDDLLERRVHGDRRRGGDGADGQMLGQDHAAGRHDHRALDDVLDLAHVAGPVVADQAVERLGGDATLAELARVLGQEVLDEERDVAPPIAERRGGGRHYGLVAVEGVWGAALLSTWLEGFVGGPE